MREILSKSLTLRGFINYDFVDHFPDFLENSAPASPTGHCHPRSMATVPICPSSTKDSKTMPSA